MSEGERRDGVMLVAKLKRGSDREGGEASELSAGLFSKHSVESPQLIHGFCFKIFCVCQSDHVTSYIWSIDFFELSCSGTDRLPLGSNSSSRVT